jgi:uncharacterized membrane protein
MSLEQWTSQNNPIKKGIIMSDTPQSGLTDNAAGALAYITFIPAIIFLVVEPYNKTSYVRFHSWQSIFLNVAAFAVYVVLMIISMMSVFLWPLRALIGILSLLIWLACFVAWILCVIQALNGKRFKLPVIGALAEKQAGA